MPTDSLQARDSISQRGQPRANPTTQVDQTGAGIHQAARSETQYNCDDPSVYSHATNSVAYQRPALRMQNPCLNAAPMQYHIPPPPFSPNSSEVSSSSTDEKDNKEEPLIQNEDFAAGLRDRGGRVTNGNDWEDATPLGDAGKTSEQLIEEWNRRNRGKVGSPKTSEAFPWKDFTQLPPTDKVPQETPGKLKEEETKEENQGEKEDGKNQGVKNKHNKRSSHKPKSKVERFAKSFVKYAAGVSYQERLKKANKEDQEDQEKEEDPRRRKK